MPNSHKASPHRGWNLMRDSSKLRGIVKYRFNLLGKTQAQVGKDVGFSDYLISRYFRGVKPSMSNHQLMCLCDYLGIEVGLEVNLLPTPSLKALKDT